MARKKKEREVLSYEDQPIEDYQNEEKITAQLSKKSKMLVIILLVSIVIVGVIAAWNYIAPDKVGSSVGGSIAGAQAGNGFPSAIVGTKVQSGNISMLSGNFCYVSDLAFVSLNNSAGYSANRKIKYSNPALVTKGNKALVYNQGDIGFQLDEIAQTTYEGEAENKIITADIATDGSYVLVTEKEGYASKLTVFNADHTQKFAFYFSEYYVNSVSLSENGKNVVASGVSAIDGVLLSAVYVLDFSAEEPVGKLEFLDNMIFKVSFLRNGKIAAVGDTAAALIQANYQDKTDYTYNGDMLTAMAIDAYHGFALSLSRSGDGQACDIRYISGDGNADQTIPTDLKVTSLSLYGNAIGVLSKGTVLRYNHIGEKTGQWDVGVDARTLHLSSERKAYILGVSEVRTAELK